MKNKIPILAILLVVFLVGCDKKSVNENYTYRKDASNSIESMSVNKPEIVVNEKQIIITKNKIKLPNKTAMSPKQYAAWWAGVPVHDLKEQRDQTTLNNSPEGKKSSRIWDIDAKHFDVTKKVSTRQEVQLDSFQWILIYRFSEKSTEIVTSNMKLNTLDDAKAVAWDFMEKRGFDRNKLTINNGHVSHETTQGIPLMVSFTFTNIYNKDGQVNIDINMANGTVLSALFTPGISITITDKPRLTIDQARVALAEELKKRGFTNYTIMSEGRLRSGAYRYVKTPMYEFVLEILHKKGYEGSYRTLENWLVDGIMGTAGKDRDFPKVKDSIDRSRNDR